VREACQAAIRGQTRTLDVGWVRADEEEPRYFGNGLGLGFDAIVNIESRKIRRLRGFAVYLVAVLKTLVIYYDAPRVTIQIDEAERVQCSLMISIMNGQRMGGGFYTTPDAQMDDGLLDLCITNKVGRPKMVAFVPRFMRGTHTTDRDVAMRQGCRVTVTSDTPWAAQVDGEIYGVGARRFEVALLPQRLRLLC
jgi:diacylglycerol kinase family enzyme